MELLRYKDEVSFSLHKGEIGVLLDHDLAKKVTKDILKQGSLHYCTNYHKEINYDHKSRIWKKNIGYSFKDSGLLANLSLKENVNLPVHFHEGEEEQTIKALNDLKIPESYWDKRPHTVPSNIRKKTLLARSTVLNPMVLILEEPLYNLNQEDKRTFSNWIYELKNSGTGILIGTDEIYTGLVYADWAIHDKKLLKNLDGQFSSHTHQMAKLYEQEFVLINEEENE
jgi:ABC-type lipoprotein export system ATPase subunit